MKFVKLAALAIIPSIALGACNIGGDEPTPLATQQDTEAIYTQAYLTVAANLYMGQTQTVAALPPSLTPLPSSTPASSFPTDGTGGFGNFPTPTLSPIPTFVVLSPTISVLGSTANGCNDGAYVGETAPFDGEKVDPKKDFKKGWTIMNTGTCTWDEGYQFYFFAEYATPGLQGYSIVLRKCQAADDPNACMKEDYTKPGHSQSFVVHLKVWNKPGVYIGKWKLRDDGGNFFGPLVSVCVLVGDVVNTCFALPTSTPTP